MSPQRRESIALVTGATGLLGSHLCEQLVQRDVRVRAIIRPTSDASFLTQLGVELCEGDLTDPSTCRRAMEGANHVFHAAAKVGDWGSWREFERDCMQATHVLATAAADAKVERFVHISSTSAYGHPKEGGPPIEESAQLGQNVWWPWDYYTRSKVDCERILWDLADTRGLRLTVIRPSWLFGERDRTTTARIVRRLRGAGIPLLGQGDNPLSAIYAGCVAEAALMAAGDPASVGEAYNITDQGAITQREFFSLWADAVGTRRPHRHLPYALVFAASFGVEAVARLIRKRTPPVITRYATWLMGRHLAYSTEKARQKLGWTPSIGYEESIRRTVAWYLGESAPPSPATRHAT